MRRTVIHMGLAVVLASSVAGCTSETGRPASSTGAAPAASAGVSTAGRLSGWWRLSRIVQPGTRAVKIPPPSGVGLSFEPGGVLSYGGVAPASTARYRVTADGFRVEGPVRTTRSRFPDSDPITLATIAAGSEIMLSGRTFTTTIRGDQLSLRTDRSTLIFRHATATRLMTSGWEPGDGAMQALISGRIGADARGCVTIGGSVLAAPKGSTLSEDGQSVTMPVVGTLRLGQVLTTGGGSVEEEPGVAFPDRYRGCASTRVSVINPSSGDGPTPFAASASQARQPSGA